MRRGALLLALALAACKAGGDTRAETALQFPSAHRPVSELGGNSVSTEVDRDNRNEADTVMSLAAIKPGMTVADIGAGEGYYTVRLAERVGADGRVLAQDIDKGALERLGGAGPAREARQRLDQGGRARRPAAARQQLRPGVHGPHVP